MLITLFLAQLRNPILDISPGTSGTSYVNNIMPNIVLIGVLTGVTLFFFMFMIGALEWIFAGGDAKKIEDARKRIVNALTGLLIMLLLFVFVRFVNVVLNINIGNLGIGADSYQQTCRTSGSSCRCSCNSGYHVVTSSNGCPDLNSDQCSTGWCMCEKDVPPTATPLPTATSTPTITPTPYCNVAGVSCTGTIDHGICVNDGTGCSCAQLCNIFLTHQCDSVGLNSTATDGLSMVASGSSCNLSTGTVCGDIMYSTGTSCTYSYQTNQANWTRCSCVTIPTATPTSSVGLLGLTPPVTPSPTNIPPSPTVVPTSTPRPTNTPFPTNTPLPTATPTRIPTNTPIPTATATPLPTNTPLPTATRVPVPTRTPTATPVPVCSLMGETCVADSDCCNAPFAVCNRLTNRCLARLSCAGPAPFVIVNSATGINCSDACLGCFASTCLSVGVDFAGTDGRGYMDYSGPSCTTSAISCNFIMNPDPSLLMCGDGNASYLRNWTYCRCSSSIDG